MRLKSVDYCQFRDRDNEWLLHGLRLGKTNLLVGKNASGKTRALNVVNGLAKLLSGEKLIYLSGDYDLRFEDGGHEIRFKLHYEDGKVVAEQFRVGPRLLLNRGAGGKGRIYAEKMETRMQFQTPEDQIAAVARRDSVQHPFLEPLHEWARSLRHWSFGSNLGKNLLYLPPQGEQGKAELVETDKVVPIFLRGKVELGDVYTEAILKDMAAVGFALDQVDSGPPFSIGLTGPFREQAVLLRVREVGVNGIVDQYDMAQGMYRCLNVVAEANYFLMSSQPSCFLIDDIGEGLDFERSCRLINLLMEKTADSEVQLVMSTNDRFVMNAVPLRDWSVLVRDGNDVRVKNYGNAKRVFDSFAKTGLNNFDFFSSGFLADGDELEEEK